MIERQLQASTNEDFEFSARWTDSSGIPYTLTSGAFQVRLTEDAADPPLLTATVTIDGSNWANALIPQSALAVLGGVPITAVYDFVVTRSDGRKKVLARGSFIVKHGVTR